MNYYTFQPNCYSNTINTPNILYTPSLNLTQPILTKIEYITSILRQALRISVTNYAVSFSTNNQPNSQSLTNSAQQNVKQGIHHEEVEMVLEQEEKKQNFQISDPCKQNTTLPFPTNNEKTTLSPPLQLTDDELPSKQTPSLNQSSNDQTSKKRRNHDNSHFKVIVPEVDLVQTAYIPALPIQSSQLTVLRNKLLLRQVTQISDFCKGRRDKRQIRMLAN